MENIVRKGEIAYNKQFLFFSQCFLTYMAIHFHFGWTLKCRLQFVSIWTGLKICRLVMSLTLIWLIYFSPGFLNRSLGFHELIDEYWSWRLEDAPEFASSILVKDYEAKAEQYSVEVLQRRKVWYFYFLFY